MVFHPSNTTLMKTLIPFVLGWKERVLKTRLHPLTPPEHKNERLIRKESASRVWSSLCYLHNSSFVIIIFNLGQPTAERLF